MDVPRNQIFSITSFNDLFSTWRNFPNAVPYAGGTDIFRRQLPPVILSLDKLADLQNITRSEHYLEIGAMVNLNRIAWLGKIVPDALSNCIENIAGVQLRNIATIGGNICSQTILDTSVPLTALDAQFELRGAHSSRWVSAQRFYSSERTAQELLTRIRLPLDQWDYSFYRKFTTKDIYNTEAMVIVAKTHKDILNDIRIVYKSGIILRSKACEDMLIGKRMPLSHKTTVEFLQSWRDYLGEIDTIGDFAKDEMFNCLEFNIYNLAE
jgi:CO/xanthine dehydrogenase FAD-binding subunit